MYNIGDSGEPCKIPAGVAKMLDSVPLSFNCVVHLAWGVISPAQDFAHVYLSKIKSNIPAFCLNQVN